MKFMSAPARPARSIRSAWDTCASTAAWGASKKSRGWSSTILMTLHVGRMAYNHMNAGLSDRRILLTEESC